LLPPDNESALAQTKEWVQLDLFVAQQTSSSETPPRLSSTEGEQNLEIKENFQFILQGTLTGVDKNKYLVTPDGREFKVKRTISNFSTSRSGYWQVEPTTDNLGKITSLVVEKRVTSEEFLCEPFSLVIFEGKIHYIFKRLNILKIKLEIYASC